MNDDVSDNTNWAGNDPASSPELVAVLDELSPDQLAARILERDRILLEGARFYWLQNGLDLNAAKRLLGYGNFEAWCKDKLSYSKSKAERLMRVATLFGPMLESGNLTDLPPRSLAYDLSAPSIPDTLRNEFIPRLLAGESSALTQAQQAIKDHKWATKKTRHQAVAPEDEVAAPERPLTSHQAKQQAVNDSQRNARDAAVMLIFSAFREHLPMLLAHVDAAMPGEVFGFVVERELRRLATDETALPAGSIDSIKSELVGSMSDVSGNDIQSSTSCDHPEPATPQDPALDGLDAAQSQAGQCPSVTTNPITSFFCGTKESVRARRKRQARQHLVSNGPSSGGSGVQQGGK